jgi:hypothetical protein
MGYTNMALKYLKMHCSLERTGLFNGLSSIDVEEIEVNGKNEKKVSCPPSSTSRGNATLH